jgi:hypothetical protein
MHNASHHLFVFQVAGEEKAIEAIHCRPVYSNAAVR